MQRSALNISLVPPSRTTLETTRQEGDASEGRRSPAAPRSAADAAPSPAGRYVMSALLGVQEFTILTAKTMRAVFARPLYLRDIVQQMDVIGVGSTGIVVLTGLFTGMVLTLQSALQLSQLGNTNYVGRLVATAVVRELGPVIASLVIAGRAGASIAAQIGSMKVTEQIDALSVIGTDPIKKLVVPRLVAALLMLPLLVLIDDVMAIVGGLLIATVKLDVGAGIYMRSVFQAMAESGFVLSYIPKDVFAGLLKPVFFGGIIAMTGCYCGLQARGGTEGIGAATTRAVVTASVLILSVDYFLTQIFISVLFA